MVNHIGQPDYELITNQLRKNIRYRLREFGDEIYIEDDYRTDRKMGRIHIEDSELLVSLPGVKELNTLLTMTGVSINEKNNDKILADIPIGFKKSKLYDTTKEKSGDYDIDEEMYKKNVSSCIISALHVHDGRVPGVHLHVECDTDDSNEAAKLVASLIKLNRRLAGL